ncbi:hypothetical protein HID58_086685, partial [Brassica napus]
RIKIMGGRKKRRQKNQRTTTRARKNIDPVVEEHVEEHIVEELSDGNSSDDLSAPSETIKSFLLPTLDEETLMARIVEDELEYDKEDGPSNMWSAWLTIKGKPIWWKELYELDVAAREFPKKKDKGKVSEEASSSNDGLENVLKGFEERLMASLTEVNVKVETMGKRLDGIEKKPTYESNREEAEKRGKKQDVMATQLDAIEKGQGVMKKKVRRMARKLKEKVFDNQDMGFNSQGMDFDRDFNRKNSEEAKEEKKAQTDDAEMVDATQEHETEAKINTNNEPEEEKTSEAEAQFEEGKDVEQETEGKDVQEEGEGKDDHEEISQAPMAGTPPASVVDQMDETTPAPVVGTPPRGRTKAMAARKGLHTPPRGRKNADNPQKFTTPPPEKEYVYHHSGFPLLSWKGILMRLKDRRRSLKPRLRKTIG